MNVTTFQRSMLINFFREFYQAFLIHKAVALTGLPYGTNLTEAVSSEASNNTMTHKIQQDLEGLLNLQMEYAVRQTGELGAVYYRQAQYVMVAFTDEIFLRLDWPERRIWESHLFESRMYGTHVAGSEVFQQIDTYLRDQDPSSRDLGAIYLWILGLGFQGKYHGMSDQRGLVQTKNALYSFVVNPCPNVKNAALFFPQAYGATIQDASTVDLPNPRLYNWSFLAVIAVFIVLSWGVWYKETSPLRSMVHNILNTSSFSWNQASEER